MSCFAPWSLSRSAVLSMPAAVVSDDEQNLILYIHVMISNLSHDVHFLPAESNMFVYSVNPRGLNRKVTSDVLIINQIF